MSAGAQLTGSAWVLAVAGLALLFLPEQAGSVLGFPDRADVAVQLFAGGLLAIAVLNWTGRGAIYGSVYGRPIVLANFGLGMITAGTLTSAYLDGELPGWAWILAAGAAIYAVSFWRLMRRPPWDRAEGPSRPDGEADPRPARSSRPSGPAAESGERPSTPEPSRPDPTRNGRTR